MCVLLNVHIFHVHSITPIEIAPNLANPHYAHLVSGPHQKKAVCSSRLFLRLLGILDESLEARGGERIRILEVGLDVVCPGCEILVIIPLGLPTQLESTDRLDLLATKRRSASSKGEGVV